MKSLIAFILLFASAAGAQIAFTGNQQWSGPNALGNGSPPVSSGGGGSTPTIAATVISVGANAWTTNTANSVAAGSLLLLAVSNEGDSASSAATATLGDTVGLTWTKRADAQAANSGNAEIWTTTYTAGGNINVTNTWAVSAGTSLRASAVLFVITGQNASQDATGVTATAVDDPNVSITPTANNALVIGVTSDFAAIAGTVTLRNSATLDKDDDQSGSTAYRAIYFHKSSVANSAQSFGWTLTGTSKTGVALYSVNP